MASAAEILPPEDTDIIEAVIQNPREALMNKDIAEEYLAKFRDVARFDVDPDVNTAKGRKEFTALAGKFVSAKTAIDKFRLSLTADLRQQVADINDAGKILTTGLAEIATQVRAPLTAWEDAEKAREQRSNEILTWLQNASVVRMDDTSATIRGRGKEVYSLQITKEQFGKRFDEAMTLKNATVTDLRAALETAIRREDEQAELEQLRAAQREREEKEATEKAEREAAERKAAEEKAEQDRITRAAEVAAEKARLAAEAEAQRTIDEANRRAEEAEAARVKAERDAEAERQRIAQKEEAARAEQARRERSRNHRSQIHAQTQIELSKFGEISDEQALAILKAIAAGKFSHVRIEY